MSKAIKGILRTLLGLVLLIAVTVGGYVLYIALQYYRIEDHAALDIVNPQAGALAKDTEYTALTFNIGFGAYDHGFSFFMDEGVMADGTRVKGTGARAKDKETALRNTYGAIETAAALHPDFILLQEADVESDRSRKTDQTAAFAAAFPEHASVFASNFHSAFLAFPLHEFHGAVQSGLLTLSRYTVVSALRRSLPVDAGFTARFFDLDRCFSLSRLPVEGGGELSLINVHMSAFDEGGIIRAKQMELLSETLKEEYAKGNWVIVGGDYNHVLNHDAEAFESRQLIPGWITMFDHASLPEGFSVVQAENAFSVATCRSTDIPYTPGVNYSAVIDGFIVSPNVKAAAENIDANFEYSDHNPVLLRFTLL